MGYCPAFLKQHKGFTLVELVVIIGLIVGVSAAVLTALKPAAQIAKSRDARRKADLQKLKVVFEDYYNDNKCYPVSLTCGASLSTYLEKIPCDPKDNSSYGYTHDCTSFRIYAKLENDKDAEIPALGCQAGCGPARVYNYGVSSSNVGLESGP